MDARQDRTGDVVTSPNATDRDRSCSVDGCYRTAHGRGWCKAHYERWRRHGSVDIIKPVPIHQPGSLYCPTDDLCERCELDDWCDTMRAVALDYLGMRATFENPPADALARPVKEPCWVGVGSVTTKGYRQMKIGGRLRRLPRVALAARRVVLGDLVVDHLCRNRECVNPWHMEAVTVVENTRRGASFAGAVHRG